MRTDLELDREARLFAGYLLGRSPDRHVCALYRTAMEKLAIVADEKDRRLLGFVLRYPRLVGLVDAGTAMFMRDAVFRRKLLVMFAILECSPAYSDLFLPGARSPLYPVWLLWVGGRAIVKSLIGAVIVWLF